MRRNLIIFAISAIVIIAVGVVFFLRSRNPSTEIEKDYSQSQGQSQTISPVAQPEQTIAQPAQTIAQPIQTVAEPQILNQWTDEKGYTWRKMSDGSHHYWDGTNWIKHG